MREVYIIDAVRSPIGKYGGGLKSVRPDDLASQVIKALINRNPKLPTDQVDDVIVGNANGAGEENRNVARMAGLLAGLPTEVGGATTNRLCGSGLDAVMQGARAILSGEADIIISGGVESMTRAPFVMAKPEISFPRGDMKLFDTTMGWRFENSRFESMYGTEPMIQTAENLAEKYNISREQQDDFAYDSQLKASKALKSGQFKDEIIPIEVSTKTGIEYFSEDEFIRHRSERTTLANLRTIYTSGTVTAGNASGINDGAAMLLLVSGEKMRQLGLKPLAKYIYSATAGVEPTIMGIGPVKSTEKLLAKTGLSISDFDQIELNEAFAAQALACIQQLDLDTTKVNVNGGAIALGHPLGASGARILTTLIHSMKKNNRTLGLATMCIGVGQGISLAIENVNK